jgi:predicted 2-oxoglutarate/Fe(II)-dependent dioxygenase YbiX
MTATIGQLALMPLTEALVVADRDEQARAALRQAPDGPGSRVLRALLDRRAGDLAAAATAVELAGGPAAGGIVPAPVAAVPDFLPAGRMAELLGFVHDHGDRFSTATVGNAGAVRTEVRNNVRLDRPEVQAALRGWFLDALRAALPAIVAVLGERPFTVGAIEIKLGAYPGGSFFRLHRDRPAPGAPDRATRGDRARRLSFVYFLHPSPRSFAGGDLLLHDTDVDGDRYWPHRYTRVVPTTDTLACFPSGFYHQVTEVREATGRVSAGRLTVNGHIHEDESPG